MLAVQAGEDLAEIVDAAALAERLLRAFGSRANEVAVPADVFVDGPPVRAAVATREAGQRADQVVVCGREHVMQAEPHPAG